MVVVVVVVCGREAFAIKEVLPNASESEKRAISLINGSIYTFFYAFLFKNN